MAPSAKHVQVVLPDVSSLAVMAAAEAIGKARRLYINNAAIMEHGLAEECLGCLSFAEGKRAQGHSEECRAHLGAELAKSEGAPPAIQVPPIPSDAPDAPMDDVA